MQEHNLRGIACNHERTRLHMSRFQVALVAYEASEVPPWVARKLAEHDIEFVFRQCATTAQAIEFAAEADLIWILGGSRVITAESLAQLKRCGAIIRSGSGTDNIPSEEATRHGIIVVNTPQATSDTVSDHAIALLLSLIRQIPSQDHAIRRGLWDRQHAWPRWSLSGSTLGLIGLGHIARAVAQKMSGFEISRLAFDPFVNEATMRERNIRKVTLPDVLSQSDFVSIHIPLTNETHHLIGERELRSMKPNAILINTSRGPVVDESALVRALTEGWIGAAGLDVFETEPLPESHPLTKLPNVVLTPHCASRSDQLLDNLWRYSVEAVLPLSRRQWPASVVNRKVKPRWQMK